jgi:dihydroorotate dehydrogenase
MKMLYKKVLRPILFRFDPERVHDAFVVAGEAFGRTAPTRSLVRWLYGYRGEDVTVEVDGLRYARPVVLAAGFDSNGRLTRVLPSVSFGGVEVGSVTARPCAGNPKPRMTRLIRSRSILVNKGLRNDGVDRFIERMRNIPRDPDFVIGVSIARTNDEAASSLAGGLEDYRTSLLRLVEAGIGDYYTINISCPNVFGGESFAEPRRLRMLLTRLAEVQHDRPMYVKMPINLRWTEFRELLEIIDCAGLHGVVIGNLNKSYDELDFPEDAPADFRGGLSGAPCFTRSTELIRRTRTEYRGRLTIIGCGGILSADDAMRAFDAGADLVQLITGMIFEGPHLMKEICNAYATEREGIRRSRSLGGYRRERHRVAQPCSSSRSVIPGDGVADVPAEERLDPVGR